MGKLCYFIWLFYFGNIGILNFIRHTRSLVLFLQSASATFYGTEFHGLLEQHVGFFEFLQLLCSASSMYYIRFRTSCSFNFLSTFFSSNREVELKEESPQLENYLGMEELSEHCEVFLMCEISFLKEKSRSSLFMF